MRLSNTRLNAESQVKPLPAAPASADIRTVPPQMGNMSSVTARLPPGGGFGLAIRPSRRARSRAVVVAAAAVIFVSTVVIGEALTAVAFSFWKRTSAASPAENSLFETPAGHKGGVLRLPPLEPEQWRSASSPPHSPLAVGPAGSQSAVTPSQATEPRYEGVPAPVRVRGGPVSELAEAAAQSGTGEPDPALLIAYGNDYLARKDVAAARLFYRRAADGGSASGAAALAASYDPVYLNQRGLRGVRPEPKEALRWYHVATEMGDPSAKARVNALIDWLRSAALSGDNDARTLLEQTLR